MIEQGAGSPMEAWDPALKSNTTYSHPWAGSPAYLVYRGTLGIAPLEPGYKRFSVTPQLGRADPRRGHHADRARDDRRRVRPRTATRCVKVPANSTAVVTLPGETRRRSVPGCHLFRRARGRP